MKRTLINGNWKGTNLSRIHVLLLNYQIPEVLKLVKYFSSGDFNLTSMVTNHPK
jgi:hypothetical protein